MSTIFFSSFPLSDFPFNCLSSFPLISHSFYRFIILSIDLSSFPLIYHPFHWFLILSIDFSFFPLISHSFHWFLILSIDFSSFQLISHPPIACSFFSFPVSPPIATHYSSSRCRLILSITCSSSLFLLLLLPVWRDSSSSWWEEKRRGRPHPGPSWGTCT